MNEDLELEKHNQSAPEGSRPAPLIDRARKLLGTASALLIVLGLLSLAIGFLAAVGSSSPAGLPLVFLGGGVIFVLLGAMVLMAMQHGRAFRQETGKESDQAEPEA